MPLSEKEVKELTPTETLIKFNESRWGAFWQRIGVVGRPKPVYRDLVRHYQEPSRFYHTLEHISRCLDEFKPVRPLAENPNAVEMALWYHDAIYDPHAKNNEERSASLAFRVTKKALLSDEFATLVANLILATKHNRAPSSPDAALLMDIDLAGFGKPWQEVERNSQLIRQEYAWVPEEEFRAKRVALLSSFLARPTIYHTAYFQEMYESQARKNLQKSVNALLL